GLAAVRLQVRLGAAQTVGVVRRPAGEVEGGADEHGGGDVAQALDGVAPAAVGVLALGQPGDAACNQAVVRRCGGGMFLDEGEGAPHFAPRGLPWWFIAAQRPGGTGVPPVMLPTGGTPVPPAPGTPRVNSVVRHRPCELPCRPLR